MLGGCLITSQVFAAGEVRLVETSAVPATPFRYTAEGSTHTWGAGDNQLISAFSTDSYHTGILPAGTAVDCVVCRVVAGSDNAIR